MSYTCNTMKNLLLHKIQIMIIGLFYVKYIQCVLPLLLFNHTITEQNKIIILHTKINILIYTDK